MKRRAFIKSATALMAMPMLPSGLPISAAQYAKAANAAKSWAYTTPGNLKHFMGVDLDTSKAIIKCLQNDGILGATGSQGVAVTKSFLAEQSQIALKTTQSFSKLAPRSELPNLLKEALLEDEDPSQTPDKNPDT